LNENSKKILEQKHPKNEIAKDVPYHEYLIIRGKQTKEKLNEKKKNQKNPGEEDCTFKPKILKKKVGNRKDAEEGKE
jgi:hypothetical protein